MSGLWGWSGQVGGAMLVAAIELDGVQAGQFMLSRPIVLGPLLGLLFSAPWLGLTLGACCEFFSLDDPPVGGSLPLNATVAAVAAVLMACGPCRVPPELALPAGLAAGWAHQQLETALRQRRRSLSGAAEYRLRQGTAPRLGGLVARALWEQAAGTFAVMLFCVLAAGPALHGLWPRAPRGVADALEFGWRAAPWLGLGVALQALKVRP